MAYDEKTAERLRQALSEIQDVTQMKMMGGLVFMKSGHMCCGVSGQSLMVRIGPDAYEGALSKKHVRPMEIGKGRRPRAFVIVDPPGFKTEKALASWIRRGLDFVSTLPPKKRRAKAEPVQNRI